MRKAIAICNLSDEDYKTQLARGYDDIPAGAEVEFYGYFTNFYGRFAQVKYKGNTYSVPPYGIKFVLP